MVARPRVLLTASSLGVLAIGASLASGAITATPTSAGQVEYLFVLEGHSVRMTPVKGRAGTYAFAMPVRSPRQSVIWFADRPQRETGRLSMSDFAGLWAEPGAESFGADPPNAALSYPVGGREKTVIVTMARASLVRRGSAPARTLKATMTVLPEEDVDGLAAGQARIGHHASRAHSGAVPARLSDAVLFVDAYGVAGNGGNGGVGGAGGKGGNGGNGGAGAWG